MTVGCAFCQYMFYGNKLITNTTLGVIGVAEERFRFRDRIRTPQIESEPILTRNQSNKY